jgi:Lysine methyltransferase
MWPSAVVLSRWLMANPCTLHSTPPRLAAGSTADVKEPSIVERRHVRILEIGAGCGLVGLLAARMIQAAAKSSSTTATSNDTTITDSTTCTHHHHHHHPEPTFSHEVLLSDFNPEVLENLQRNILLNNVSAYCSVVGLDFYQQVRGDGDEGHDDDDDSSSFWTDMNGTQQHKLVDIVLGADIICQPSDAVAAAHTIRNVLRPQTGRAIIVCASAEHRYGVDHFARACQDVGLRLVGMQNVKDLYHGKLVVQQPQQPGATEDILQQSDDLNLTTGYVDNMNMTLFTIERRQLAA